MTLSTLSDKKLLNGIQQSSSGTQQSPEIQQPTEPLSLKEGLDTHSISVAGIALEIKNHISMAIQHEEAAHSRLLIQTIFTGGMVCGIGLGVLLFHYWMLLPASDHFVNTLGVLCGLGGGEMAVAVFSYFVANAVVNHRGRRLDLATSLLVGSRQESLIDRYWKVKTPVERDQLRVEILNKIQKLPYVSATLKKSLDDEVGSWLKDGNHERFSA